VAFEVETIAFLLCTMGLGVTASSVPAGKTSFKQIALFIAGIALYFLVGLVFKGI
jgi:hypothetical protein